VSLTRWLHRSLRTVINTEKRLASAALAERRAKRADEAKDAGDEIVKERWDARTDGDGSEPPDVSFSDDDSETLADEYRFSRANVLGSLTGPNAELRGRQLENKIANLTKLLASYGLLEHLSKAELEELLGAIRRLLDAAQ